MKYNESLEQHVEELQEKLTQAETTLAKLSNPYINLCERLDKDPDYAWTFHCNIAMSLIDGKFIKTRRQANFAAFTIMQEIFSVKDTYKKKYEKEFV
jgi:hypothetical protein